MTEGWTSLVEERLRRAQAEGAFDDLPGRGRPLPPLEDGHAPAELRLAHSLLRANGLAPEWVTLGQEVKARRERLLRQDRRGSAAEDVARLNRDILRYNLMAPAGVARMALFRAEG